MFKFISVMKSRFQNSSGQVNTEIIPEDLHQAAVYWLKKSQSPIQAEKCFSHGECTIYTDEVHGTVEVPGEVGSC